jgi:CheY-like chemotaxis protein
MRAVPAADGREALTLLRGLRPALVLTDLMMPDMDGYELMAAMDRDPALATIPVFVISGAPPQARFRLGQVVRTMRKPLRLEALLQAVQAVVRAR